MLNWGGNWWIRSLGFFFGIPASLDPRVRESAFGITGGQMATGFKKWYSRSRVLNHEEPRASEAVSIQPQICVQVFHIHYYLVIFLLAFISCQVQNWRGLSRWIASRVFSEWFARSSSGLITSVWFFRGDGVLIIKPVVASLTFLFLGSSGCNVQGGALVGKGQPPQKPFDFRILLQTKANRVKIERVATPGHVDGLVVIWDTLVARVFPRRVLCKGRGRGSPSPATTEELVGKPADNIPRKINHSAQQSAYQKWMK